MYTLKSTTQITQGVVWNNFRSTSHRNVCKCVLPYNCVHGSWSECNSAWNGPALESFCASFLPVRNEELDWINRMVYGWVCARTENVTSKTKWCVVWGATHEWRVQGKYEQWMEGGWEYFCVHFNMNLCLCECVWTVTSSVISLDCSSSCWMTS